MRRPLSQVFATLNERYFNGQLPRYRVHRSPLAVAQRLGECDVASRRIRVSDALPAELERRVLLHEMCHAATPGGGHGRRWRAAMQRLAEQGETWATEEASLYRRSWLVG
jgi:predicted metal-dependent hydrolase